MVSTSTRLDRGQVYTPLRKKSVVENPLINRMTGATTNRMASANRWGQREPDPATLVSAGVTPQPRISERDPAG